MKTLSSMKMSLARRHNSSRPRGSLPRSITSLSRGSKSLITSLWLSLQPISTSLGSRLSWSTSTTRRCPKGWSHYSDKPSHKSLSSTSTMSGLRHTTRGRMPELIGGSGTLLAAREDSSLVTRSSRSRCLMQSLPLIKEKLSKKNPRTTLALSRGKRTS